MFNMTLFLLEGDEVPDVCYGEHPDNKYQNTTGIVISQRRVPADIPKDQTVTLHFTNLTRKCSFEKRDTHSILSGQN